MRASLLSFNFQLTVEHLGALHEHIATPFSQLSNLEVAFFYQWELGILQRACTYSERHKRRVSVPEI